MRRYPTWEQFRVKNAYNKTSAFETLCRFLFKEKYGIAEALPYAYNNAGNETASIEYENDIVGFQAKYFEGGETINDSQAEQIKHSIETAHAHYPKQNKIIIYTTLPFGNPPEGKTMTDRQREIEDVATACSMSIEWIAGNNILDAVAANELVYELFFDTETDLRQLDEHLKDANVWWMRHVKNAIICQGEAISISRQDLINQVERCLSLGKNVVIEGESGSGKSAIVKAYCEQHSDETFVWINASQFYTDDENTIFHYEKAYTLDNVCLYYRAARKKTVIIDSAEKLSGLGTKYQLPLYHLIDRMKDEDWQFIFTVRKSKSDLIRKNIFDEYDIRAELVEVPLLSDSLLNAYLGQNKISMPSDAKLYSIIHNLFYLARYCEISDKTPTSPIELRNRVWEDKIRGGIEKTIDVQESREQCVLQLAKSVLTEDRYRVSKEGLDGSAIAELQQDEIIVLDKVGYSFAHDIYLEWAIGVWFDIQWEQTHDAVAFLNLLDNNVLIYNFFRRWISEKIETNPDIAEAFGKVVFALDVDKKWKSAIVAEVLRSKQYASVFFSKYDARLKENDYRLGVEVLSELPINCQEIVQYFKFNETNYPILRPVGSGWDSAINFIGDNYDNLWPANAKLITSILKSYYNIQKGNPETLRKAGLMVLKPHINVAETRKKGEENYYQNEESAYAIVANYFAYIHPEIKKILDEIITNKWVNRGDPYFELSSYIAKAQDISLLILEMHYPNEILTLMDIYWSASKEDDEARNGYVLGGGITYDPEVAWGLSHNRLNMLYYPISGLQTCIRQILIVHPEETVDFLIKFVDKCVRNYAKFNRRVDPVKEITLTLPDGTQTKKLGNQTIWNLYRGTSRIVTPHVLPCIHMALENYLLESIKDEKEEGVAHVKTILNTIIREAESVSLLAIAASIVTCYPSKFLDEAIVLTSDLEFLYLDLTRCTSELHSGFIEYAYHRNLSMLDERKKANALPHRQTHLEQLLFRIQINLEYSKSAGDQEKLQRAYANVDSLNKQLAQIPEDDRMIYQFILSRCDVRRMPKEKLVVDGVPMIQYTPALNEEQKRLVEKNKTDNEKMMLGISLRIWAENSFKGNTDEIADSEYEKNPQKALADIKNIKEQLSIQKGGLSLLRGDEYVPSMVCAALLNGYTDKLSENEITYCEKEVIDALSDVDTMLEPVMSSFRMCLFAVNAIIRRSHQYDEQCSKILRTYAALENEVEGVRCCDSVAQMVKYSGLWNDQYDFMRQTVLTFVEEKTKGNISAISTSDAEAVLCLLVTYPTIEDLQELANACLEILSHVWDEKDKRRNLYIGTRTYCADVAARMLLSAPAVAIPELMSYFTRYIGTYKHDTLLTAFIYRTIIDESYESFWNVWREFFNAVIEGKHHYLYDEIVDAYMLNPRRVGGMKWDGFKLKENDVDFYERIANVAGDEPIVLLNIIAIANSIGKMYYMKFLPIIDDIITRYPNMYLGDRKAEAVFGLETICQRIYPDHGMDLRADISFRNRFVRILDFMKKNDSLIASSIKSQI